MLQPTPLGRARTGADGCRRYRVTAVSFDTRVRVLETEIQDGWEEHIKEMWRTNQRHIREVLIHEFGADDYERKIQDFVALGAGPWSVVASHNRIAYAARTAFVAGAYYPALVGAAGLGERILNQIILELRNDFASHPDSGRVMKNQAFDDWKLMTRVLCAWGVLTPEVATKFKRLGKLRNDAVHYNLPALDVAARDEALEAVLLVQEIIEDLFHPGPDALIPGIAGAEYLTLASEQLPFVRRFFIPACALVSPRNEWVNGQPPSMLDDPDYGVAEGITTLTDEEFAIRLQAP